MFYFTGNSAVPVVLRSNEKAQKQAVEHNKGPMMVLAGPGAGKTLVITYRTKTLIEKYGVEPGKILVITFTKAAAEEMRAAIAQ